VALLCATLYGCVVQFDESLLADSPTPLDAATDRTVVDDLPRNCKTAGDCEDGVPCTNSTCVGGNCNHALVPGNCLIAAQCHTLGTISPQNPCLHCVPSTNAYGWTNADGNSCNDGVDCTHSDRCQGGVCQGTSYSCSDGLDCTTDRCTGVGPAPGGCAFDLDAGNCLIDDACVAASTINAKDACQICDPASGTSSWASIPKCVTTLAGDGTSGFLDGAAGSARFNGPYGIAVDGAGKIHVADQKNHRIRLLESGTVSTVAGGTPGYLDGPLAAARFNGPRSIAVDPATGDLIVADSDNHRIRRISGTQVTTVAGDGTSGFADGPVASARFSEPEGLVVESGKIYVVDFGNHRIRVIDGGQVSTLTGGTMGNVDGPLASARFRHPRDIAVDGAGTFYVADTENYKIRRIAGGQVTTLAGSGSPGMTDGPAGTAKFKWPYGVAVDAGGTTVYVADTTNNAIRQIAAGQVTTLAGTGAPGLVDGPAVSAKFNQPNGVAVDTAGALYISDYVNDVIRGYTP